MLVELTSLINHFWFTCLYSFATKLYQKINHFYLGDETNHNFLA